MSVTYLPNGAMQPAAVPCVFDNEEFADFESAHQFSIGSEEWTLTELDEAALGIEQKPTGVAGGVKLEPEAAKKTSAAVANAAPSGPRGMKASMLHDASGGDDDELFGGGGGNATRGYNTSFNKSRPTMISAKYRLKEERRKVLKISINKLKKIEDPESSLRRSVLINNTMKRLQREAREERREKQQIHSFPRYTPSYKSFVLREEPPKPVVEEATKPTCVETVPTTPRLKPDADKENASPFPSDRKHPPKSTLESCFCEETMDELVDVTSLDDELSRPLEELANPVNLIESASIDDVAARCASRKRSFDEDLVRPLETLMETAVVEPVLESQAEKVDVVETMEVTPATRKRSYEEVEDSEIHDVLSQFYMPPTPRMLTSIDDDEDEEVNVVDIDLPVDRSLRDDVVETKLLGFDELVSEDLDDASPCKRARFEAPSPLCAVAPYEGMTLPNDLQTKARPSDVKSPPSFEYLGVDSRTSVSACEVGSLNCGTVGTCVTSVGVECSLATPRVDVKDSKAAERRVQISRLSERMGWTSLMPDPQDYKLYNNGLCKTLTDCCYQEANNNMAADASKYSCAHAAITELQSQVYHNYVTSLES